MRQPDLGQQFVTRIDTHEIEDVVKARVIRTRIAG